jgi:hypothetical protein
MSRHPRHGVNTPWLVVGGLLLLGAGALLGAEAGPDAGVPWTVDDELSTQVIVSGICLFIGGALVNTPISRWLIPFIVALSGGAVYCGYVEEFSVANFILGFYAGAASTGIYEATKGRRTPGPGAAEGRPSNG